MKTVYFVRHGETRQNKSGTHQYPEDPLSEHGRIQAAQAGKALQGKRIEVVLASDLERAVETGSIIATSLGVPIEYSPLLREVRRPTFLWGKSHYSFASLFFFARYFLLSIVGTIRIDNEETLRDFEKRIGDALSMLTRREENVLAVVTHRGVLSILSATMQKKGRAQPLRLLFAFLGMYAVDNGEITHATWDGKAWHIVRRNENKHLVETQ